MFESMGTSLGCSTSSAPLRADCAWELGAAFERLSMPRAQRVAVARSAGIEDGNVFLRAWVSCVTWWAVQAVALHQTTRSAAAMARSREGVRRLGELIAASGARVTPPTL